MCMSNNVAAFYHESPSPEFYNFNKSGNQKLEFNSNTKIKLISETEANEGCQPMSMCQVNEIDIFMCIYIELASLLVGAKR